MPRTFPVSAYDIHNVDRYHVDRLLTRRLFWNARADSGAMWTNCGVAGAMSGAGNTAAHLDSAGAWMSCTSAFGDNSGFGRRTTVGVAYPAHKPHAWLHVRLGATITTCTHWVGIYDTAVPPTNAAAYVASHVALRYVAGTDAGWVVSSGTGAAQTVSASIYPATALQELWAEFDGRNAGEVVVSIYNAGGVVLARASVIASLPSATAILGAMFMGFNIGGGFARANYFGSLELSWA
jgi:hypothetical protein